MGRWAHLDTDEERLPEGMTRVGYDADEEVYTYRDEHGAYWEGARGCQYGPLSRVAAPKRQDDNGDGGGVEIVYVNGEDDDAESLASMDSYVMDESGEAGMRQKRDHQPWRREMRPLMNFFLLAGVTLFGVFWFMGRKRKA